MTALTEDGRKKGAKSDESGEMFSWSRITKPLLESGVHKANSLTESVDPGQNRITAIIVFFLAARDSRVASRKDKIETHHLATER